MHDMKHVGGMAYVVSTSWPGSIACMVEKERTKEHAQGGYNADPHSEDVPEHVNRACPYANSSLGFYLHEAKSQQRTWFVRNIDR